MIKIVTDSTCDLPPELIKRYDIRVVPINILFGNESYEEGVNIDRATFYRKIEENRRLPTTSQPSAGRFAAVYRSLIGEAEDIISIHVTGKLSGTCRSAEMARTLVAGDVKVHVFDSLAGSAGLGYLVLEAARMAEAGEGVKAILRHLEELRPQVRIFLTLEDLRYARMSGRVGRLQETLASILNVKPIIALNDGVLDVAERVRTKKAAINRMLRMLEESVGARTPIRLAVVHAEAPGEGRQLLEKALDSFNCVEHFMCDLAVSLAVHFGPGTLGLVSCPA